MSEITITKDNFEKEVLQSDVPVIVDFWATWCGPCKMVAPILEDIAKEKAGELKVGKVNVDDQMELAQQFGIMNIPTMLFFNNGELVNRHVGACRKQDLAQLFDALL